MKNGLTPAIAALAALFVLAFPSPARGQALDAPDIEQIASGLSVGGGVHLWGSVIEIGQEVLSKDSSFAFECFYTRSDRKGGGDRTRSDIFGADFIVRFHAYLTDWLAVYAGGGAMLAVDYWRWRDREGPGLDYGLSGGIGLLLTAGFKIRLFGDFYADFFVKAGAAGGLEEGGRWLTVPAGFIGIKIGIWTPVTTGED